MRARTYSRTGAASERAAPRSSLQTPDVGTSTIATPSILPLYAPGSRTCLGTFRAPLLAEFGILHAMPTLGEAG